MPRLPVAALLMCLALPARAADFTLLNEQTYATQKGAWDVKVLDINGDARPEIFAALFDHEWVAVLPNNGQGRFPAAQATYSSNENSALELADVSGDHKPDMAHANWNVASMSVRLGTGVGGFGNKANYATGVHPRDLVAADLNGDGFNDYAVACEDGSVTIVKNRGATGLDPVTSTFSAGTSLRAIGAADFDRDGKVDLVVLDRAGGRVVPLRNLGGFAFAAGTAIVMPTDSGDLLAQDLSEDGWPDVAVANNGYVSILLNDRTGAFLPKRDDPNIGSAQSILAADFNADGHLDLLTCNSLVHVTLGIGDGTFAGVVECPASGANVAAAGDVDGDGRLDVVTGNYFYGTVSVLMNRPASPGGTYHFKSVASIACDVGGYDVVVGDLDRDGHPDAVGAILDGNEVEVFHNLGDGTGRLADPVRYPGGQAVALDVGDYSGDGWPDVASANYAQGTMSLRLNQGDGTLSAPADAVTGTQPRCMAGADFDGDGLRDLVIGTFGGLFLTRKGIPGGLGPVVTQLAISGAGFKGAATGDLDGDGRPDVALADAVNHKVYALRNVDGASFSTLHVLALSNKLSDVVIRDLDGDGDQDLGLVNEDNLVQVCLNDGTGHFPSARPFTIGALAQTIDAADLDGNGLPELVVPIYNQNRVQALTNIGGGYYNGITEGVSGTRPRAAACADFDGDGRIDVVTMDFGGGTLRVLRNLAGPGPPPVDPYPCDGLRETPPSAPAQVIALDLDGDGSSDMATTGAGLLSIYRGLHETETRQDLATGPSPQSVAAGDLDGDGRPELAVANQGDHTVSIYRNRPDGAFAPLAVLPVGVRPRFVVLADLDRDGRPDIATANEGDATHVPSVTILFNPPGATWNPVSEPVEAEAPGPDPQTAEAGSPPDTNQSARVDLPSPGGAVMLAVADLDGDGANDLVVNTPGAHAVAIRYQVAPGRFGLPVEHAAGGSAWTAIADFDADGRADLAIADPELDLVRVLWNAAADPFAAETDIPVEDDPRAVAAGDIVADGLPDIAYVASAEGWYGVLKTGAFRDIRLWSLCISGAGARSVALASCAGSLLDAYVANVDEGTIFRTDRCSPVLLARQDAGTSGAGAKAIAFALGHPAPNPASARASIAFALPARGPAHLGVYDVRGRLVKSLVHGVQEAGEQEAVWNGTNEAGARVAAGVYFCRLTCAAGTQVERMVWIAR